MRENLEIPSKATPDLSRLLERLKQTQEVSEEAIERAHRVAEFSGARLDHALRKLGLVSDEVLLKTWSELLDAPLLAAEDYPDEPAVSEILSPSFLMEAGALPIAETEETVRLAITDPLDTFTPQAISKRLGKKIELVLALPRDLEAAFQRLYPELKNETQAPAESLLGEADLERLRDISSDAPVVRFVDTMLERAVELGASDIHLSASLSGGRLRYRIDGVLQDRETVPLSLQPAVVSRLKVLADLDIAERRLPQDGRIRVAVRGREIDLRVATLPSLHGEGAVLRILDRSAMKLDLETLGFSASIRASFEAVTANPNGILLVTGPTGSGKTTTLYAALRRIVSPERNVISVEDPVEYQLDGVQQIQVHAKIGLTFAHVLRSVLRSDPDVIMIGEIRDRETASIAIQAALTGHFVLATLHTNTAAAAIPRLIDMGVEPYLLAPTLRGVLAQRLVRRLCPECKEPAEENATLLALAHQHGVPVDQVSPMRPAGCPRCGGTGFKGRSAIAEHLSVDEPIRSLIVDPKSAQEVEASAKERGFVPMLGDGLARALTGETTLEEVLRVTGES